MTFERFTAADLEPSAEEQDALRRARIDRVAATLAVLAAGVWVGGMVALGACAAPFVFRLTPAPYSGNAMGSAFARFDQIALGAAVVILGAEVTRTWAGGPRARHLAARVRRICAIVIAMGAAYGGLSLTPRILELHRQGAQRNVGPAGEELQRVHVRAESVGKVETGLGVALVVLHVFTLGLRKPDDDELAAAPLPPGPLA